MSPDDYRRDMLYHAALSIGITLLEKGLLSQMDFARIKKMLLKKYDPYLGKLLSESIPRSTHSKQTPAKSISEVHNHVTIISK